MKYIRIPLGAVQTNCYFLINDEKECLIVDPGGEAQKVFQTIEKHKVKPLAILLTHAHFDHIGAVDEVRERYNLPVHLHRLEKEWPTNPELNGSRFFPLGEITAKPASDLIQGEGEQTIGGFTFQILETPGHTPGSVSFYFAEERWVVSGDALFARSIGRTDLPGGNEPQLLKSIHDKLLTLPEDTLVLSGHGEETTVEEEMDGNPFLNGF
ncbi:MBL fold metallo-hydrolase [Priestia koreensis]|uniref:MBL fold metallo-hydrolase n=1 Tax=Priestia koreensis TaxID=284581 RepID=UPI003457BCD2